jgi:hypothetical protein
MIQFEVRARTVILWGGTRCPKHNVRSDFNFKLRQRTGIKPVLIPTESGLNENAKNTENRQSREAQ